MAEAGAPRDVAAVPVGSSTRTRILLPIAFGGGLFVLILFFGFLPDLLSEGIERGIPNNALAVLVVPANSPAREALIRVAPALAPLTALSDYDTALVVQSDPLALHIIVYTPRPEDMLSITKTGLRVTPVDGRVVVIGDQAVATRLRDAARLPWWTRLRVAWNKTQHAGVLLFARDAYSPWLLGYLESQNTTTHLTIPFLEIGRYTSRTLESDIQDTLFNLTRLLLPTALPLKLPDNSVVQELRSEASALSWSIKEENGPTYTLFQNNSPIVSYRRLDLEASCSNTPARRGVLVSTHPPLAKLNLEISLLKHAIFFCLLNGDKL